MNSTGRKGNVDRHTAPWTPRSYRSQPERRKNVSQNYSSFPVSILLGTPMSSRCTCCSAPSVKPLSGGASYRARSCCRIQQMSMHGNSLSGDGVFKLEADLAVFDACALFVWAVAVTWLCCETCCNGKAAAFNIGRLATQR